MDLTTAQHRIYRWADNSPRLEDKRACDVVFAALRERDALAAEVAQWRAQYGDPDDPDPDNPDPDSHFYD